VSCWTCSLHGAKRIYFYAIMKLTALFIAGLTLPVLCFSQTSAPATQISHDGFPQSDFVLHDPKFRTEKSRIVLGSDGKGGNTFAVYGGSDMVQVSSLSFSGDGSELAVGSLPNIVDLWDISKRKIVRSFKGGAQVALSFDGKKLAKDGDGIGIVDVATGKVQVKIPWNGGTVKRLSFDQQARWLLVSANGDDDRVFDVSDGKLLAELKNTQQACFSRDGSLIVGGNAKHLITWSTQDWTKRSDLPNGPEYVVTIAADVEKDLVVIGGPKTSRLVRLSSGNEIAKVGIGYTNFAGFNSSGTLIFDYPDTGFGVWDVSGKRYCLEHDLGINVAALSSNDRWLAIATSHKGTDVMIWSLENILAGCKVPSQLDQTK
jgi:WD40 repeat protein